jgi:hypothetical protein
VGTPSGAKIFIGGQKCKCVAAQHMWEKAIRTARTIAKSKKHEPKSLHVVVVQVGLVKELQEGVGAFPQRVRNLCWGVW